MLRKTAVSLTTLAILATIAGCNWLTPLVFVGDQKKEITAEFDKLAGSKTAILVWTPPETLFDFPYARFELCTYVGDKLAAEMQANGTPMEIVDSRDIEDFVQRNLGSEVDPQRVGKHFKADYVVYLEVIEFQMRDPDHPQLLQGKIAASVTVHDVKADPDQTRRYELSPVQAIYPERSPVLMSAANAQSIRQQAYQMFAEQVARKFYEHTIEL